MTTPKDDRHYFNEFVRPNIGETSRNVGDTSIDNTQKEITTTWLVNRDGSSDLVKHCQDHGLTVVIINQEHLCVTGTVGQINGLLNITLTSASSSPDHFTPSSAPSLPKKFQSVVKNIMGLDTTPIAHPRFVLQRNEGARAVTTFTPIELARLYNFPSGNGQNKKIGIIELGGGYVMNDLMGYFSYLGIPGTPNVIAVGVDGASNNPNDTSGANYEVVLDTEVIIAICPLAETRVYFAPNSSRGFYNAIHRAITDGCSAISISWGAPERYWSRSDLLSYNALFQTAVSARIVVTAASGDTGSSDGAPGNNVDFPASSPWVLGCGGTTLVANVARTAITSEVVWKNNTGSTGGGVSAIFAKPLYQSSLNTIVRRGVPDVAGNADPNTGYILYYNGGFVIIGGTSAVSPLWAALMGRIYQNISPNTISLLQTPLYQTPSICRDITSGNNGAYRAGLRWDACTGLGSPSGQSLQTLLSGLFAATPSPAPSHPPVAQFIANRTVGSGLVTVVFRDKSTNNPTSWLWRFGNGMTSTAKNPIQRFGRGSYTIILTATNAGGSNTITKIAYIRVR